MPDLLLEIGLEEVPARMIAFAQMELGKLVALMLSKEGLIDITGSNRWTANGGSLLDGTQFSWTFSTPRRLAVLVKGVADKQKDLRSTVIGPSVTIAYKDGVPTPAAHAFAKKNGVTVDQLLTTVTPKGEYILAKITRVGLTASEIIAKKLPEIFSSIYWAKSMYWRPGKPERFVRPVLWLVCLLGEETVPLTFAGKTAGRATYGHRVLHGDAPITITAPSTYLTQLESAHVLADVEARHGKIRKALDEAREAVPGAWWIEDNALIDAVTHLTEWPDVLLGNFEPAYLTLPEEVLVTVMRDHQKYFAVEDEHGKLAPHFLTVTNIALTGENTPIIRQGNERVLRARFNDARFFWEFDQRTPLVDRVKLLEHVTFQKDLGSYAWKTTVNVDLAQKLAEFAGADDHIVKRSAELAKADLTCELVKEFTELQGKIGAFYLLKESQESGRDLREREQDVRVADAIYWQYTPASPDEKIPQSKEAQVLGLADRFTTILHMFKIGIFPTGSKDPFALRRAGNGVVKLLAESNLPLTLFHLFVCSDLGSMDALQESVWKFLNERVEFYLREGRRFPNGVVRAVMMAQGSPIVRFENVAALSIVTWGEEKLVNDVGDAVLRAEALEEVSGSQDFADVANAFNRIKKIVAQADQKIEPFASEISRERLVEVVERELYERAGNVAVEVENYRRLRTREGYVQALKLIATLRPQVDAFFDTKSGVMVMSQDAELRANRLALMRWLLNSFLRIADFSEIVTAG